MQKVLFCSLLILLVGFGFSQTQDSGKFGFSFKSGPSNDIGLYFKISDNISFRPSLGFTSSKAEEDSGEPDKTTQYSANLGIFYHFLKKNNFHMYSGLEVAYVHQKLTANSLNSQNDSLYERKTNGYSGDIILGLQYYFNKHLAIFGEVAFGYLKQEADYHSTYVSEITSTETSWNLSRSGFGIILFI